MNEALIKRIEIALRFSDSEIVSDVLDDCRAALSRKYVPMTDDAIDVITKIYWGSGLTMPALLSAHRACARFIESEVIRRTGLGVVCKQTEKQE